MPGKRGKSKCAPYKFQTGNAERGRGAGWGQKQILRKAKHKSDKKRDVYGEKWDDSMCFCLFTHDCITCALTAWSLIHILTFQILFVLHSNIVTSCWKCLKLIDEKWIISPGIGKNQCRNCSPVETWVAKSALRIAVICAYSKIQN